MITSLYIVEDFLGKRYFFTNKDYAIFCAKDLMEGQEYEIEVLELESESSISSEKIMDFDKFIAFANKYIKENFEGEYASNYVEQIYSKLKLLKK